MPLSEIGGGLLGTGEVGALALTVALTVRLEAFWLRWEKEVQSDVSRNVEAEARKLAQGEDVASETSAVKKIVSGPREKDPAWPPPQGAGKAGA